MKFDPKIPPRTFPVGQDGTIEMKDCGAIRLQADEQVTFVTESGAEYDVARKAWGFYATPSLNGRLARFSLRTVLIRNTTSGQYFVLLVEKGEEPSFEGYLEQEGLEIVSWMDDTQRLDAIRAAFQGAAGRVG